MEFTKMEKTMRERITMKRRNFAMDTRLTSFVLAIEIRHDADDKLSACIHARAH